MQPKGNAMKKVVMIVLALSLNTLFGMKNNNQQIDWHGYKNLYFEWYGYGALGTEERWEEFKKGVENGKIKITAIQQEPRSGRMYYLAYSKKILLGNLKTARFMYPSPNNVYSGYRIKGTDVLYTIDNAIKSVLVTAQWDTNKGINNAQTLPLELHPSEDYFSNWKNNPGLWVFLSKIENISKEQVKL